MMLFIENSRISKNLNAKIFSDEEDVARRLALVFRRREAKYYNFLQVLSIVGATGFMFFMLISFFTLGIPPLEKGALTYIVFSISVLFFSITCGSEIINSSNSKKVSQAKSFISSDYNLTVDYRRNLMSLLTLRELARLRKKALKRRALKPKHEAKVEQKEAKRANIEAKRRSKLYSRENSKKAKSKAKSEIMVSKASKSIQKLKLTEL